jgi:Na+/phosphate symporter
MWETLLWLLVGAVLGFLPTWFLSNRSHTWELEEKKREREYDAREIRLKEGEEKIKDYTRDFYYFMEIIQEAINTKSANEIQTINKIVAEYEKAHEELDKGRAAYEVSVKSLGDEQLTNSLEKVKNSLIAYKNYYVYLADFLRRNGSELLQKEHDNNVKKEQALNQSYTSSAEGFIRRINELRSQ